MYNSGEIQGFYSKTYNLLPLTNLFLNLMQ